jgi:hypothetical protein
VGLGGIIQFSAKGYGFFFLASLASLASWRSRRNLHPRMKKNDKKRKMSFVIVLGPR